MACNFITPWQTDGGKMETLTDFLFLGSKITAEGDCSHEINRYSLLRRKAMKNLDSIFQSRDITLLRKSLCSQSYGSSSSYIQMWELDHKEGWTPKNWCFRTVVLEKTLESPVDSKEIKPVSLKGNQLWIFIEGTDAETEGPILWPLDEKSWLTGKDPDAGKDWGQEKGATEEETVGWYHVNGHEFKQTLGDGEGQGSLVSYSPQGGRESDMA